MPRRERYKITPSAHLLLIDDDNKVLLTRRVNTGYMDGFYSTPAGHVEDGEFPDECMLREAKEEVNIEILDLEFLGVIYNTTGTHGTYVDFFFLATKWKNEIENLEETVCDDVTWFNLDNLPDKMAPELEAAISLYWEKRYYAKV